MKMYIVVLVVVSFYATSCGKSTIDEETASMNYDRQEISIPEIIELIHKLSIQSFPIGEKSGYRYIADGPEVFVNSFPGEDTLQYNILKKTGGKRISLNISLASPSSTYGDRVSLLPNISGTQLPILWIELSMETHSKFHNLEKGDLVNIQGTLPGISRKQDNYGFYGVNIVYHDKGDGPQISGIIIGLE